MTSETHRQLAEVAAREFEGARPFVVNTDTMAPTLVQGRDIAMLRPASDYEGEGIYALLSSVGGVELYRVCGHSGLRLVRDNPAYSPQAVSLEEFRERMLARVVGRVEFFDSDDFNAFVANIKGHAQC